MLNSIALGLTAVPAAHLLRRPSDEGFAVKTEAIPGGRLPVLDDLVPRAACPPACGQAFIIIAVLVGIGYYVL